MRPPIQTPDWQGVLILCMSECDPRFTREQWRALQVVSCFDLNAAIVGLDANYHPVVTANLGVPRGLRVYAIDRTGAPCIPAGVIADTGPSPTVLERWHAVGMAEAARSSPPIR